jgi:hypothetical protein
MDYVHLSLADVQAGFVEMARDLQSAFGDLDVAQLNWQPDQLRWSVAQCLDHLLTINRLMVQGAGEALAGTRPRIVWQRLPLLPGIYGRTLIRSQAPAGKRKFTAPPTAQPSSSGIAADIVPRLVEQHREAVAWIDTLDERQVSQTIMTSPFVSFIVYSVLDACRILVAHDRRHFEQAMRVIRSPGFPFRPADGNTEATS